MILITHDDGVLTLQLNKPEKRNAIDEEMMIPCEVLVRPLMLASRVTARSFVK